MCRNCFEKNPLEVKPCKQIPVPFFWTSSMCEKVKPFFRPTSGSLCSKQDTDEQERGGEAYKRRSAAVVSLLLQGQNKTKIALIIIYLHRFGPAALSDGLFAENFLCPEADRGADLWVIRMAGLGTSTNLLEPHLVTLHRCIVCSGVKKKQQEKFFLIENTLLRPIMQQKIKKL